MYDHIGGKIKGLAKGTFIVEAIAAIITGISLIFNDQPYGILVILCGPVAVWVASWLLYGFGELIEKTVQIEENTRPSPAHMPKTSEPRSESKKGKVKPAEPAPVIINTDSALNEDMTDEEFRHHIFQLPADDLLLILTDQQDLYTDEELEYIEQIYAWKLKH